MCLRVYVYMCVCVCVCVCVLACVHMCVCACMCVHVYSDAVEPMEMLYYEGLRVMYLLCLNYSPRSLIAPSPQPSSTASLIIYSCGNPPRNHSVCCSIACRTTT